MYIFRIFGIIHLFKPITMNKNHRIETLTDMINCTNSENIDAFLSDLRMVLNNVHTLNALAKVEDKDLNPFVVPFYDWTDDGINEVSMELKAEETGETIGTLKTTNPHV